MGALPLRVRLTAAAGPAVDCLGAATGQQGRVSTNISTH